MSEQDETAASLDPLLQPFLNYWSRCTDQASSANKSVLEEFASGVDPNVLQRQWLDAVSSSMEAYLRSPYFLQMLKTQIDTMIEVKRRANELSKKVTPNAGHAPTSDLAQVLKRLRSAGRSPLLELEQIRRQLEAMENKVGRSSVPE